MLIINNAMRTYDIGVADGDAVDAGHSDLGHLVGQLARKRLQLRHTHTVH